jgi:hypothetical protein
MSAGWWHLRLGRPVSISQHAERRIPICGRQSDRTLMALQAGLPLLDFSSIAGAERKNYFAAVQAGIDCNYAPMCAIFAQIISATPAARK